MFNVSLNKNKNLTVHWKLGISEVRDILNYASFRGFYWISS